MKKNKKTVLKTETDQETIESEAKKIEETNNLITAEDLVEQAFYKTHAPDCCADKHAKNMLGMLGANIIEPDIYHDEDECPFKNESEEQDAGDFEYQKEDGSFDYKAAVLNSVKKEYEEFEAQMVTDKTAKEVFDNNYEIYVKSQIYHAIHDEMTYDEKIYKALCEDKGEILEVLHQHFLSDGYASVNTVGDVTELIDSYCDTYYRDILEDFKDITM